MTRDKLATIENDKRLAPRETEHLDGFEVHIVVGERTFEGKLIDESVTGVGVQLFEAIDISIDTDVVVQAKRHARDAIVQRAWTGPDGTTRLGLLWRAARFRDGSVR